MPRWQAVYLLEAFQAKRRQLVMAGGGICIDQPMGSGEGRWWGGGALHLQHTYDIQNKDDSAAGRGAADMAGTDCTWHVTEASCDWTHQILIKSP